ncbi:hypothetical protein ACFL20_12115, partial [Spirochaetota bacterium]
MKVKRNKIFIFMVIPAVILAVMAMLRIAFNWTGELLPDHASGAWINLAVDFIKGIFYRPLYSIETGYGGTRFMPVFFIAYSCILKITDDIVSSGSIINVLTIIGIYSVIFLILRQFKINRVWALLFAGCIFMSPSLNDALTSIRGDLLASLFSISGILFSIKYFRDNRNAALLLAVFFFELTFFTKLTSLHGISSVFIWYIINGRKKDVLKLVSIFVIIAGLGLILINAASNGEFIKIMLASATGGASFSNIVNGPRWFYFVMLNADLPVLLFLLLNITVFIKYFKDSIRSLPGLYFLFTLAVTIVICGSPGAWSNHLIDLFISLVLFIGFHTCRNEHTHAFFRIPLIIILLFSLI